MFNETWLNWRAEIVKTFEGMEIISEPFPYFYVEPFLPDEMYNQLDRYWPSENCFWGQNDIADKPLFHEFANLRKVVIIDDAAGFSEYPEAAEFWSNFRDIIRGPELAGAVLKRCREIVLSVRNDLNCSEIECWSNALLEVDMEGFHLGPHIDSASSLFSLILYVPDTDSPEGQGTSAYIPSDRFLEQNPHIGDVFDTGYHDDDDFEEVFRAPYRRNGLYGMVNTPMAFHGVRRLGKNESGRRTLLWSITSQEGIFYPSALDRVERGITPEMIREQRNTERLYDRMANLLAAKYSVD